jgi:hypothetical protein
MHIDFGYVAQEHPWTFGAALERAEALDRGQKIPRNHNPLLAFDDAVV